MEIKPTNKSVQLSYPIWQLIRKAAFDREIPIKNLTEGILTGQYSSLIDGDAEK